MSSKQIKISAAVIVDDKGQTLLVRKAGTQFFMQPGCKIDLGESAETALTRELMEELELSTLVSDLRPLGSFRAVAANEHGHEVVADLFQLNHTFTPRPANEIAEAIWVTPKDASKLNLAPLTRDHVMPILESMNADM